MVNHVGSIVEAKENEDVVEVGNASSIVLWECESQIRMWYKEFEVLKGSVWSILLTALMSQPSQRTFLRTSIFLAKTTNNDKEFDVELLLGGTSSR